MFDEITRLRAQVEALTAERPYQTASLPGGEARIAVTQADWDGLSRQADEMCRAWTAAASAEYARGWRDAIKVAAQEAQTAGSEFNVEFNDNVAPERTLAQRDACFHVRDCIRDLTPPLDIDTRQGGAT